jgi:RNase P subunit RPR2
MDTKLKSVKRMNCPHCNTELIWGGDHTYEDFAIHDEDGIVRDYTCPNDDCQVELIEIYYAI